MAPTMTIPDEQELPLTPDQGDVSLTPMDPGSEQGVPLSVGKPSNPNVMTAPDQAPPAEQAPSVTGDTSAIPAMGQPPAPTKEESEAAAKEHHADIMNSFANANSVNRGQMLNLNPNDPSYLQKLAAMQTREGLIRNEQAKYVMNSPYGSEGNHPGIGGKLLHGLSVAGQIAGRGVIGEGGMSMIPGSQANLEARANSGQQEVQNASKMNLESAQANAANQKVPVVPKPDEQAMAAQTRIQKAQQAGTPVDPNDQATVDSYEKISNVKVPPTTHTKEGDQYDFGVLKNKVVGGHATADEQQQFSDLGAAHPEWVPVGKDSATYNKGITSLYKGRPDLGNAPLEYQVSPTDSLEEAKAKYKEALDDTRANKPEKTPKQMIVVPDPSGKTGGTVMEVTPGMTIPPGSKTVTGDLNPKGPTADEQRRGDLAENLNENFDQLEDILKRRPELFGKVSGRITQIRGWLGSDDPDVAALDTIKHQVGMAQVSAHGMRSAQGVESAAESLLNGFKNGADATKNALETARKSVATFEKDVSSKQQSGAPGKTPQAGGHSFTINGKSYANVPDDVYTKYKTQPGFKE
jgi:hypothetical protein